ncbi:MAG: autotransporter domain-containing protein [Castellaniella sp.]|uniref:autotransporter domain-containing protein n=1 Tax=Castellaniella sp. TaxID=1955812 RepID=UPI003A84A779
MFHGEKSVLMFLAAVATTGFASAEPISQNLDPSGGFGYSTAVAVSADGSVIIGEGSSGRAFRWTDASQIESLGSLSGGSGADANGISADGRVIVGSSAVASGRNHAFRWTEAGRMQDLGDLGGDYAEAYAVSADGNVIVGRSELGNGSGEIHAFRWTEAEQMQDLGTLGGNSRAEAVSEDGGVIAGISFLADRSARAFRWTEAGRMQDLGTLGGRRSYAKAVSADGSVIIGDSEIETGSTRAFRWTEARLMEDLGTLGGDFATAIAVSADGSVIVGNSHLTSSGDAGHAYRWTEARQMEDLGSLGGNYSRAYDVSADGSVIVGNSDLANNRYIHAFRWTEADQMQDLGTLGGNNSNALAVSDDGRVIVGNAGTADGGTHAALWKFPEPVAPVDPVDPVDPVTPSVIDVDNTIKTVGAAAQDTFEGLEMQRRGLDRLQEGCDIAQVGKTCYRIMMDVGGFAGNADVLSGISIGHAFTDNFSAGFSIGHSFWRDLPESFGRNRNNIGGGLYVRWKQDTANGDWYLRGAVAANRYKVKRTRAVLSYTEAGAGDAVMDGWGASFEIGRNHALSDRDLVGYYGGLRYSDLNMDGYTEHNAVFPFTYSQTTSKQTTAYIGANYTRVLSDKFKWSINGELEQDIAHKDPSVVARADYIGALKFDSDFAHTRASLSSTLAYAVTDDVSMSVTPYVAGTSTRDTAYGVMISLSGRF